MNRNGSAIVMSASTALVGAILLVVGVVLLGKPGSADPANFTQVTGTAVAYAGLLIAALGGAGGLRRATGRRLRMMLGLQIATATLISFLLASTVILAR